MKNTYLLIIILIAITIQSFAQKEGDVTKAGDYKIEAIYHPNAAITENSSPAAIGLASFDGKYIEGQSFISLTWKISKKLGTFVVEHSVDNEMYKEIGRVENSIGFENSRYTFEAREFEAGINFYRLKQEVNGDEIYSEIKAVTVSKKDDIHILNIIDEDEVKKIRLRLREEQKVTIELYDTEGNLTKVLLNQEMTVNEIIFRTIKKSDFPPGKYFILIKGKNFKQSKKITLQ